MTIGIRQRKLPKISIVSTSGHRTHENDRLKSGAGSVTQKLENGHEYNSRYLTLHEFNDTEGTVIILTVAIQDCSLSVSSFASMYSLHSYSDAGQSPVNSQSTFQQKRKCDIYIG